MLLNNSNTFICNAKLAGWHVHCTLCLEVLAKATSQHTHLVNRSTGPGPGSSTTVQRRCSGVAVLPAASEPATSNCHSAGSSQRRTSGEAQGKGCPSGTACSVRLPAVVTTVGCNGLVLLQ